MLNPPVNGKIQGLFKAFECFSSTFQCKFYFQGLFKTVLYIQVLFKPVRTLDKTLIFEVNQKEFDALTLNFACLLLLSSADFFQNQLFEEILS